jgi:hypothetical protein
MKTELSIKAAVYLRAAELVEQGHSKYWLAQDLAGKPQLPESESAVSFCIRGAVLRAAKEAGLRRDDVPSPDHFVLWNNAPDTTAAMVAAKLREQAFA